MSEPTVWLDEEPKSLEDDLIDQVIAEQRPLLSDFYRGAFQDGVDSVRNAAYDNEKIEAVVDEALAGVKLGAYKCVLLTEQEFKDTIHNILSRLGFGPPDELPDGE